MRNCALLLVLTIVCVGPVSCRSRESQTPTPSASPAAAIPQIASKATSGKRVIFIGLDGADWSLLDQYVSRGVMPTLAKLVSEGSSGTVKTISPPLSPLIWTTMMTGVSPLEHRILDFLRVNPTSQQREPITSDERKVPAVWNMATAGGKKVGALGYWATYPAESVNGLMVSDRLFTFLFSETSPPPGVVYPASMESWARDGLKRAQDEAGYDAVKAILPWLTQAEYTQAVAVTDPYAHPVSALRRILIETKVYDGLGHDWYERESPDLLLLYIQGTDSIGHVFAPYAPPRQSSVSEADYGRYKDVAERYFALIDQLLARYVALAQKTGSTIMLASDHGFLWGEGRPTTLSSAANTTAAKWHAENGVYLLWGPGVQPSQGHAGTGRVDQVSATLLALAGLPSARHIAGPALPGTPALSSSTEPVDYRAVYTPATPPSATAGGSDSRVDEDTVAKLRALGYIGASEGKGRAFGTRTAGSLNNEGLLLRQEGKQKEAIDAFDTAISVDPNLASALWNLSDLLWSRSESLEKSDALLVRAFANGLPEGTKYVIGRAIGYQRNGQVDRSISLLNQAAAAKPNESEVWLFRGRYRVERGECAGAVDDFRQAARLTPNNAAVYASQGLAELCAGNSAAARASFQKSLQLDPNQPKVREYLRGRGQ
ncbi:MAG TPA: alkaline phosphatase family protein [Vicinamibacterales bacterium]|nr:alkaline phosphatase family protein [Vicinamibacterales bacterium]